MCTGMLMDLPALMNKSIVLPAKQTQIHQPSSEGLLYSLGDNDTKQASSTQ